MGHEPRPAGSAGLVTQIRFPDGGTSLGIKGKDAQRDECECACKERRYDRTPLTFGLEHFATASLHRHRLHPCTKAATELHFEGGNHIACLLDGQVVAEARDHDACSILHAGLSGCPLEMVSRCCQSFTVGFCLSCACAWLHPKWCSRNSSIVPTP